MNIMNINDLKINIQGYNLKQRLPLDVALKHLSQFYIDDLVQNQKVNVARALTPLKTIINVTGAIYGVFRKPYKAYMEEKGLINGLFEGTNNLYNVLSQEYSFITQKVSSFTF